MATLGGELLARVGLDKRSRLVQVKSCTSDLNQLCEWIESNRLNPIVEKVYPITAASESHRHIESKHTTGKIVLSFKLRNYSHRNKTNSCSPILTAAPLSFW
jgi:NADPH:quinone reductase-like Zn-dependent oxidoreductase